MFDFLDAATNENRWQRRNNIFWRSYHPFNKNHANPMPSVDSGLYVLYPSSYPEIPTLRDHNGTLMQAHRQPDDVIRSYSQSNEPSVVVIRCYSGGSFISTTVRDMAKDLAIPSIDKVVTIQSGLAISGSTTPSSIIYSIPIEVLLENGYIDIEHGTCRLYKDIYSAVEAGIPGNMGSGEEYPTNGNRLSIVVPKDFNMCEFYTILGQRSLKIPVTHSETIEVPSLIIYDDDNIGYTSHEIIWPDDNEKEIVVAEVRLFKTDVDAYRAARLHLDKTVKRKEQIEVEELRSKCDAEIEEIKKKHAETLEALNNKFEKDKEEIQHKLEVETRLYQNKVVEREALDEEIKYRNEILSKIKETIAKEEEKAKLELRATKASDSSSMLVKVITATAVAVTAIVTVALKFFF